MLGASACDDPPRGLPLPSPPPQRGGVLRLLVTEPAGLDPALSEDTYQWLLIEQIFDGLVSLDPELNVVPALARTWTISRDGRTYHFTLRADARFQNGRTVTADDVAWSFLRAARIPGGLARDYVDRIVGGPEASAGRAAIIEGVRVEGKAELIITLREPYAPFLGALALPHLRVVPREEVEGREKAFARHPVGTGAFSLGEWGSDGRIVLVANETHWAGRPFLDRVEVLPDRTGADATTPFLRGEVDVALLAKKDRERLPAGTNVVQRPELGITCLGFNVSLPPVDDPRVRRAAALALDRDAIVAAGGSAAVSSRAITPVGMSGGSPHPVAPDRDVVEARRILADAGHRDGRGLQPLELWTDQDSVLAQGSMSVVARNLGEVGIPVRDRSTTWSRFSERVDAKKAPAYVITFVADTPDRDSFLRALFHSRGADNYSSYADLEVDQLLETAGHGMDPRARNRLYNSVEDRVGAANVIIPLFSASNTYALRAGLQGFALDPMGLFAFSRLSWERPR